MVAEQVQLRMSKGLIDGIDHLVKDGKYASRSDVVRDAVRHLLVHSMVGLIPNKGDSVKQVRVLRRKMDQEIKSFKDIKKWNELID
jgi:Arc/MetJ-type ribon-helix-helix transcriptional regulator